MSVLNSNTDQLPHPPTKVLKAGTLASDDKIMTGMILPKPLSAQELADIRSGTKALFLYRTGRPYRGQAGLIGDRTSAHGFAEESIQAEGDETCIYEGEYRDDD